MISIFSERKHVENDEAIGTGVQFVYMVIAAFQMLPKRTTNLYELWINGLSSIFYRDFRRCFESINKPS